MKRKSLVLLTTSALLLALAVPTVADTVYKVVKSESTITVNGEELSTTDSTGKTTDVLLVDGVTYVPLRNLSETLGLEVNYDKETKGITVTTKEDDTEDVVEEATEEDVTEDATDEDVTEDDATEEATEDEVTDEETLTEETPELLDDSEEAAE